jgi:hypothetical protein
MLAALRVSALARLEVSGTRRWCSRHEAAREWRVPLTSARRLD